MPLKNLPLKLSKVFLAIILSVFLISSNSCKKDTFVASQNISGFKNEFQEKLYRELLEYNKSHHLLDSINPSERLDWKKMILRVSSNRLQPSNYELPILKSDETCNSFLEFSFSKDKQLVNITIRKFDLNLSRLQKGATSLSQNDMIGNILYFLGKKGVKISPSLAEAKGVKINVLSKLGSPLDTSIIRNSNTDKPLNKLMEVIPSVSGKLSYTPKPTNPAVITCDTAIQYSFYFDFGEEVPTSESLLIAESLNYFFFDYLNARHMPYDLPHNEINTILFHNNYSDVESLKEVVRYCALYAADRTKSVQNLPYANIIDFASSATSSCVTMPPVEPPAITSIFPNNPCASALVNKLDDLTANSVSSALNTVFGDQSKKTLIFEVGEHLVGSGIDGKFYQRSGNTYRIYINPEVLQNSSQEYMIATFYHEAIHAYLAERLATLGAQQYAIQYGNWGLYNDRLLGVQDDAHLNLARAFFVNDIRDAILAFNPKFNADRATALAEGGILTLNSSKGLMNSQERNTNFEGYNTGTKCQ